MLINSVIANALYSKFTQFLIYAAVLTLNPPIPASIVSLN